MEKIYEHINTSYNTSFFQNFNSLEPIQVNGLDEEKWEYFVRVIGTKKHPHFSYDETKGSFSDEKTFTENYGNPLCQVEMTRRVVCVEKTDQKISLKLFIYSRGRKPGKPYFTKSTALYFLTYN
mgnify:FL=1